MSDNDEKETKILTVDDILNADDLPLTLVEMPEWNGSVYIRPMTGSERDKFESASLNYSNTKDPIYLRNLRAKFIVSCVVKSNGEKMFNDKQVEKLGEKSAKSLDRLFQEIQKVSGLDTEKNKDTEKN